MMKRMFMLLSLALMVVAAMALSGVAQAASQSAKCKQAAILTFGPSFDTTAYNFIAGSDRKNDNFSSKGKEGVADVFCGFGGNDEIGTLAEGDIFIGGAGGDSVIYNFVGIFIGGDGNDTVDTGNQPVDGPSGT